MSSVPTTIDTEEISEFLSSLYGLDITAHESSVAACEKVGALGAYVDDDGVLRGYVLCDLSGAAILGAALTQIPVGAVEDSVESGELPDNLKENVSEVLNIAVNLIPNNSTNRLVLKSVSFEDSPAEEVTRAVEAGTPVDLKIQRYGDCTIFVSYLD